MGNGVILTRAYDQQYRVTGLQDTGAAPVRDQTYVYDAASNIDRIQDNLVAANTQDFVQDALNRITADSGKYGVVGYLYDSVGNRTQRIRGGVTEQTITYTASANRSNQLNSTAYTYDGGGNTLSDGPGNRSFSYDDTNRLTEIRVGGVLKGTYLYNANRQRVIPSGCVRNVGWRKRQNTTRKGLSQEELASAGMLHSKCDNDHDPKCCEVRRYMQWNRATPPHNGPTGSAPPQRRLASRSTGSSSVGSPRRPAFSPAGELTEISMRKPPGS